MGEQKVIAIRPNTVTAQNSMRISPWNSHAVPLGQQFPACTTGGKGTHQNLGLSTIHREVHF